MVDAERYYNSGLNKFKNKSFRSAYNDFSSCLSYKSSYKDAFKLKSESLEKGTIRVAISTFSDWTNLRGSNELYSNVYNSLRRDKSAFIKLYDKDNLNGETNVFHQ